MPWYRPQPFGKTEAERVRMGIGQGDDGGERPVNFDPGARVLGAIGPLVTRMARSAAEVETAQALRHTVFCGEMGAAPCPDSPPGLDADRWDSICDHLLVIDTSLTPERIVGTYRLLDAEAARQGGRGLYSQTEFDVDSLLARHPDKRFVEIGRSCVLPQWRGRRAIETLWQGIWAHILDRRYDAMIGCASFPGADRQAVAEPLSFLFHHARAEPTWDCAATAAETIPMNTIPADRLDLRRAFRALPPLVRGYLRLGARFASTAVVDRRFGTIDVLVVMPVASLNPRYVGHFGPNAGRFSAGA